MRGKSVLTGTRTVNDLASIAAARKRSDFPRRRGWDTETFIVIRYHYEAANKDRADLGDNHEPGQDKDKLGEATTRN